MDGMFGFQFDQPIGNWDVGQVTSMSGLFNNSKFNHPIGDWDVSNISDMTYMFATNSVFNQDLSKWCVKNIPSRPTGFRSRAHAWVLPEPVWERVRINNATWKYKPKCMNHLVLYFLFFKSILIFEGISYLVRIH